MNKIDITSPWICSGC